MYTMTRSPSTRKEERDLVYRILADIVVIAHLAFVGWAVLGGFLVLRWPRLAWLHVPAFAWSTAIEFTGWICPLTPLENHLRRASGGPGFEGGFVDHYLMPILYPPGLTRETQIALGAVILGLNATIYAGLLVRTLRRRRRGTGA
jgi:hypothetical protein